MSKLTDARVIEEVQNLINANVNVTDKDVRIFIMLLQMILNDRIQDGEANG